MLNEWTMIFCQRLVCGLISTVCRSFLHQLATNAVLSSSRYPSMCNLAGVCLGRKAPARAAPSADDPLTSSQRCACMWNHRAACAGSRKQGRSLAVIVPLSEARIVPRRRLLTRLSTLWFAEFCCVFNTTLVRQRLCSMQRTACSGLAPKNILGEDHRDHLVAKSSADCLHRLAA